MMGLASTLVCFLSLLRLYSAIPPEVCFQQFKWEDCGMPPKAVIYYYKSGSRCEVGMWRGCQPNLNMFADEYECVETCIFSLRAKAHDFHEQKDNILSSETTADPALDLGTKLSTTDGTGGTGDDSPVPEGAETTQDGVAETGDDAATDVVTDPGAEPGAEEPAAEDEPAAE